MLAQQDCKFMKQSAATRHAAQHCSLALRASAPQSAAQTLTYSRPAGRWWQHSGFLCALQEPRRKALHGLLDRFVRAAGDNHRGRGAVSGGGRGARALVAKAPCRCCCC